LVYHFFWKDGQDITADVSTKKEDDIKVEKDKEAEKEPAAAEKQDEAVEKKDGVEVTGEDAT
jgi:hypothetical protein